MPITEDLINFDIIETHKENIQSLPGGRSAKALASQFSPFGLNSPTPGDTRNLNDAIRQEYEIELGSIADSDDPLDIYDRYVKWTLGAYPSAQATPESQLRPLLERATKAFQSDPRYKSDPRYLKLWLNYIRFFSDAPRETFAYLSRHNIGEGLALFYEEFAAWLEGAGRWKQADEVYRLGVEREARPTERLARKLVEFQHRFEARVQNGDEPSSPALPTVRPALVAKMDPFASTPRASDPQAPTPSNGIGGASRSRSGKQKLAIFSDADAPEPAAKQVLGGESQGWDSIGTMRERKKENTMEVRPWSGETMKVGAKKPTAPKMAVFKDESRSQVTCTNANESSRYSDQQQSTNPRTGKVERVFVRLEAVYPNDNDEMSFDELRAKSRGWLDRDWAAEAKQERAKDAATRARAQASTVAVGVPKPTIIESCVLDSQVMEGSPGSNADSTRTLDLGQTVAIDLGRTVAIDLGRGEKSGKPKKMKIKEVKGATQTIKTNLASPTGPKLRRKTSAEPTMTLHTKAATEDILDIFNQPLRNIDPMAGPEEDEADTDYDDDDYTSGGESTGTGRISGTSDFGDTQPDIKATATDSETGAVSVSPWSDFTASKHVPRIDDASCENTTETTNEPSIIPSDDRESENSDKASGTSEQAFLIHEDSPQRGEELDNDADVVTPILSASNDENEHPRTRYIPLPPEDYEPPVRYTRDPEEVAQNRLPFMTPIVEKTESSLGAFTVRSEKDYFNSKTPSRKVNDYATPLIDEEILSSPFREIINEARPPQVPKLKITSNKNPAPASKPSEDFIIDDAQCNPVDDSIRKTILESIQPPLSSYEGYHDYRPASYNKAPEIKRYINALKKNKADGKTMTSLSLPPSLSFSEASSKLYTIRRELGKGAFAPVYLAEEEDKNSNDNGDENCNNPPNSLLAIKCEDPPTSWEFYIMSTLRSRLSTPPSSSHLHPSTLPSLCKPTALHLFHDEAYLLESYLDQGTLLDLVNIVKSDPTTLTPNTGLDEPIAMFFTIELLRTVESMHSAGILHGDLKADNCLVRLSPSPSPDGGNSSNNNWDPQYSLTGLGGWSSKGLCLIDFGRGIDMHAFRPGVQFLADWKTGPQDCVEMRECRPWSWQVDYWGMAGVVHSLLFGRYIEDVAVTGGVGAGGGGEGVDGGVDVDDGGGIRKRRRVREALKRYWQLDLWAPLFDLLLNSASYTTGNSSPPSAQLRAIRLKMEEWLSNEGGKKNGGLKAGLGRVEGRLRDMGYGSRTG